MVSHDVGVPASFQHENLLLKGGDVIICEEGPEGKGGYNQGLTEVSPISQEVKGRAGEDVSGAHSHRVPSSPSSKPLGP